jgi:predicted RNA methylase
VSSTFDLPVQNIYDNPAFFAGYKNLRQNDTGINGALEVPALCRLLPDLHGRRVLDLGCGLVIANFQKVIGQDSTD